VIVDEEEREQVIEEKKEKINILKYRLNIIDWII